MAIYTVLALRLIMPYDLNGIGAATEGDTGFSGWAGRVGRR